MAITTHNNIVGTFITVGTGELLAHSMCDLGYKYEAYKQVFVPALDKSKLSETEAKEALEMLKPIFNYKLWLQESNKNSGEQIIEMVKDYNNKFFFAIRKETV